MILFLLFHRIFWLCICIRFLFLCFLLSFLFIGLLHCHGLFLRLFQLLLPCLPFRFFLRLLFLGFLCSILIRLLQNLALAYFYRPYSIDLLAFLSVCALQSAVNN